MCEFPQLLRVLLGFEPSTLGLRLPRLSAVKGKSNLTLPLHGAGIPSCSPDEGLLTAFGTRLTSLLAGPSSLPGLPLLGQEVSKGERLGGGIRVATALPCPLLALGIASSPLGCERLEGRWPGCMEMKTLTHE